MGCRTCPTVSFSGSRAVRLWILALVVPGLLVLAACDKDLRMSTVTSYDAIGKISYTTYLYSSGMGGRWRAAFLKDPDSPVDILPYSDEIVRAVGTFDEAMLFMRQALDYRSIDVQAVDYKGKRVGYLLTQSVHETTKNLLVVNVYADGGRVIFRADEIIESTD